MKISKNKFLHRLLRSFSWSENIKKPKRYAIPESFPERLLTSLSFSFESKKEVLVRRKIDPTIALQFGKLWDKVQRDMIRGRLGSAEEALREILEMDSNNAAAYNRLGIIRAKQKKYEESMSMFKRAVKLERSASATHNLALVYYEAGQYERSEHFFRKSIGLESGLAARHIALAKVLEKQGKDTQMFKELIKAVELEPSRSTFKTLETAYRGRGMTKEADLIKTEVSQLFSKDLKKKSDQKYKISDYSDKVGKLTFSYE